MIGGEFPIPLFVGRRTNRPVHVTVACLSRTIAKLPGGRVASLARPLSRSSRQGYRLSGLFIFGRPHYDRLCRAAVSRRLGC